MSMSFSLNIEASSLHVSFYWWPRVWTVLQGREEDYYIGPYKTISHAKPSLTPVIHIPIIYLYR